MIYSLSEKKQHFTNVPTVKVFTDCTAKFRILNGTSSLQQTMKNPEKIIELLRLFR